jgi:hypothetical protein
VKGDKLNERQPLLEGIASHVAAEAGLDAQRSSQLISADRSANDLNESVVRRNNHNC